MALTNVLRLRAVFDLLEDGEVTTQANYTGGKIDLISAALAVKYGAPIVARHGGPADGDNEQKAGFALRTIRQWIKRQHVNQEGQAAASDAEVAAAAEADAELGS